MFRKTIIGGLAATAVATIAAVNVHFSSSPSEELSAIHLANIEVLAQGEIGGTTTCHNTIRQQDGNRVFYCATCSFVENSEPSFWSGTSTCSH